jgi:hypothetical protein
VKVWAVLYIAAWAALGVLVPVPPTLQNDRGFSSVPDFREGIRLPSAFSMEVFALARVLGVAHALQNDRGLT